jgi:hypothetical protein
MGLPQRIPPPDHERNSRESERLREVEFESKRPPVLAIVGIIGTLIALAFIIWWFLA